MATLHGYSDDASVRLHLVAEVRRAPTSDERYWYAADEVIQAIQGQIDEMNDAEIGVAGGHPPRFEIQSIKIAEAPRE